MIIKNNFGNAIAEALPAIAALLVFIVGIFLGVYLIFARAWIQYQSEQALYCLSESKPAFVCHRGLQNKLASSLPWGRVGKTQLSSTTKGKHQNWNVEVEWKIRDFKLRVRKQLGTRHLLQNRALRW
jgi:apolipoprotein N-acyltransferase